ncbi:DUF2867 domain-containing protein [Streptomyces sp. URMC 126]|uniref:DUF2867 domain-containing protein n=1 Tax=Streptomyces sp. URMC 126 TaxID=3423401 RepID=UPI003F19D0A0
MTVPKARRIPVPQPLAERPEFAGAHYASAFAIPVEDPRARTPEQWARAVFEDAPAPLRPVLRLGWTSVLGLRMGPATGSAGHVLGWRIAGSTPDSLTVDGHSGRFATYNVVLVQDGRVVWSTAVRFKGRAAGPLWSAARPVHHIVVPFLLRRACRSLGAVSRTR